jgi:hypothetical protein
MDQRQGGEKLLTNHDLHRFVRIYEDSSEPRESVIVESDIGWITAQVNPLTEKNLQEVFCVSSKIHSSRGGIG